MKHLSCPSALSVTNRKRAHATAARVLWHDANCR